MHRRPALLAVAALAAAAALAPVAPASAARSAPVTSYVLAGNAVFPEGSAVQESSGTFWISGSADGTIYRGHAGTPMTSVWLPAGSDGRTSAIGLEQAGGYLFVAGGATGYVWVYDIRTAALVAKLATGVANGFLNDVAVAQDGSAYVTDSFQPWVYRVSRTDRDGWRLDRWLNLRGSVIPQRAGFNLNGIAAGPDRRYLYAVHSATGQLFRIDTRTRLIDAVDLHGVRLRNGDGVERHHDVLYVVQNANSLLNTVRIDAGGTSGQVISRRSDPSFRYPTTAEVLDGRLLVVNSQFDQQGPGGSPELPFSVSSVPLR